MNNRRERVRIAAVLALTVLVLSTACLWTGVTGKVRTETERVELDGAQEVDVHLRMGAGGLTLTGGADALAEADFTYNVPAWKPTIDYVVGGDEGELWIEQPEVKRLSLETYRYEWDVRLNDDVPMALDVALGAGEGEIDASHLSVSELDLKMGVGGVELDLTGDRERDVDVTITGGAGEATVLLPAEVGVRATVKGGLGDVDSVGLTTDGDAYVNDAYGHSPTTITLTIKGGVGDVMLRVVD
jgi:hypothetical protein